MKNKSIGIFGKVFIYTILILCLVILIASLFFTRQITDALRISQQHHLSDIFSPFTQQLEGKTDAEAVAIAGNFYHVNPSFEFCIQSKNGDVLYVTPNYKEREPDILKKNPALYNIAPEIESSFSITGDKRVFSGDIIYGQAYRMIMTTSNDYTIFINALNSGPVIYGEFMKKTVFAVFLMLFAGVLCAFLFARSIAKPVKSLARDTGKMAKLELLSTPVISRHDEIGKMANDVYGMYNRLKDTIQKLKAEMQKEREMEENQRYFFTAASHELKTPIAASCALLEGMLENMIPPEEYPENLKECLKMMNEQAKLISEILEIVHLDSAETPIQKENEQDTDNFAIFNIPENLIDLHDALISMLPAYHTLAESKKLNIICNIPECTQCILNRNLFQRILSNILMNAVQNTPEGGKIWIRCETRKNGYTRLSVLNQGAYISEELLPKLFEPFYRADKARSRNQGRSGLGLTIVKKALTRMYIRFSLENTKEGVVFWMDLPDAGK